MSLQSPGIEFFESSVTPASETVSYTNGVATLGFATRGPVNTLVRVESTSDFNYIFGSPVDGYPWSHILATNVLANSSIVYFMRLARENADKARCAVANFDVQGAKIVLQSLDPFADGEVAFLKTYFIAKYDTRWTFEDKAIYLRIGFKPSTEDYAVYVKMTKAATWGTYSNVLYVSMLDVLAAINDKLGKLNLYSFSRVGDATNGYGILTSAIDEVDGTLESTNLSVQIGYGTGANFERLDVEKTIPSYEYYELTTDTKFVTGKQYYTRSGSEGSYVYTLTVEGTDWTAGDDIPADTYYMKKTQSITLYPVVTKSKFVTSGTLFGYTLREVSNIVGSTIASNYHFNIYAKYSGSGMNGVSIVKSSVESSVGKETTWSINVIDKSGTTLEAYQGLTKSTFIKKIKELSNYIEIDDEVAGTDPTAIEWLDGTYVLGNGQLLPSGNYLNNAAFLTTAYTPVSGDDGLPYEPDGVTVDSSAVVDMYVAGLGNDAFLNCDENSFSILATPSCGETLVQNAAIEVCSKRGDAMYLVDVPYDYCVLGKTGITDVISWSNSNASFQNSQAAIYYGWFAQVNPYDTTVNEICPASVYVAPKMIALDNTMGEFYAPAGVSNGSITVADYIYSPDQTDRDKMVGNDNVVNPIIYSNTRGVMIFAQKTTDRTTSPLNRVGIRRMTNAIKRTLRNRLQELLFQPNNSTSRTRARTLVANVFSSLKSSGVIDAYTIDVQSGTGANRNDLNIYLDFVPYGLIEKIHVYVNISDSDVTVSESV